MDKESASLAKLHQCRKMLYETEEIGNNTLAQLSLQREQLSKVKNNIKEVGEEQKVSMTLIARMSKWWRG